MSAENESVMSSITDNESVMETAADDQSLRAKARRFVETNSFKNTIMVVIVLSAAFIGLGTAPSIQAQYGDVLALLDVIVIVIFVIELGIKLYGYGWNFFKSGWNIFDLVIVLISLAPADEGLKALRTLRILRAMRILSIVPQMRKVVVALLTALPGMASVIIVLGIVFYIFAVITTRLYGPDFDDWFGSIGASLYSLFQIMTLESWSMGIVRPVMEAHPYAWVVFVPFIMITTFAVVNLFVGLLVNTMQEAVEEEKEEAIEQLRELVREENAAVSAQLDELKADIARLHATQTEKDDR